MTRRYCLAALATTLCAMYGQPCFGRAWSMTEIAAAAAPQTLAIMATVGSRSVRAGQQETLTAVVRSSRYRRYLGPSLVDFEVDDSRGARVFQAVRKVQLRPDRPVTVIQTFTPANSALAGTYYFKIGVFSADWKRRYIWVNDAQSSEIRGQTLPRITATGTIPAQRVYPRQAVTLTAGVSLRGRSLSNLLIDIEIYHGSTKVYQRGITGIRLLANSVTRVTERWIVPAKTPMGTYVMRVVAFGSHWSPLYAWNGNAMTFMVA